MDTNNLQTRGQSVDLYYNKWIPGMIQCGNELYNPNSKPEIDGIHLHHNDMSNKVNYTANSNGH